MTKFNAYQSGRRAASDGSAVDACPYPGWTSDGVAWLAGWREVSASKAAIDALGPRHWIRS